MSRYPPHLNFSSEISGLIVLRSKTLIYFERSGSGERIQLKMFLVWPIQLDLKFDSVKLKCNYIVLQKCFVHILTKHQILICIEMAK